MTDFVHLTLKPFLLVLLALTAARIVLAIVLPITGDEAYFYFWGWKPAAGFYDHPPMVGWWLALANAISIHPLMLRLPALVVPLVLAGLTAWWVSAQLRWPTPWAAGAALLVAFAPLNTWNVAITTDVPLMLFAGLASIAYASAQIQTSARRAAPWFIAAGLALGLALMSKYFAGLLALGFAGHLLLGRARYRALGLFLVVLFSAPAAVWQIVWNAENCWPNPMFNLVNRHSDAGLNIKTPLLYGAILIYTVGAGWWLVFRSRVGSVEGTAGLPMRDLQLAKNAFGWMAAVPFGLFAALSLVKSIGLHWVAAFVLPALLWLVMLARSDAQALRRSLRGAVALVVIHAVVIVGLWAVPLSSWKETSRYAGLVMTLQPEAMRQGLKDYLPARSDAPVAAAPAKILDWLGTSEQDPILASDGYSPAVTLSMALGQRVVVFGKGSSHARHDDILTDWRQAEGRRVVIIRRVQPNPEDEVPFFDSVVVRTIDINGAKFTVSDGRGFRYAAYRDAVLEQVRVNYYAVPTWLARWSSAPCYFCARYFSDRACHR